MIQLPSFPDIDYSQISLEDSVISNVEIKDLNEKLIKSVLALRKVNQRLTNHNRELSKKDFEYKQLYRRAYMKNKDVKTESQRRILSEMECEETEAYIIYLKEMVDDLTRESYSLRSEIDLLKTLGFNIRQEMKII